jgi:hypothetical protein
MKHAQIQISDELLREVLALPSSVYVTGVRHDPLLNTYSIVLVGDGLPDSCVSDGGEPRHLLPTYSREEGEVVSGVCWKSA